MTRQCVFFDLDHTLVRPDGKHKFPKAASDWVWNSPSVPQKLATLRDAGKDVVVFTNLKKESALRSQQHRMIQDALDIPVTIYAAWRDGGVKPGLGMWRKFLAEFGGDHTDSVFVGDAAGRPGDYSACDRAFATNTGLRFMTPEQYFEGAAAEAYTWKGCIHQLEDVPDRKFSGLSGAQELLVCMGLPASGKTAFAQDIAQSGVVNVCQDDLKTKAKCLAATKREIAAGNTVVVSNTNPSQAQRQEYIRIAEAAGVPHRVVYFCNPMTNCVYLNNLRDRPVPKVVFHVFNKKLEVPPNCERVSFKPKFSIITAD
uniref:Uncharacterized protein n=1 Tax=viral metagenome TaxID=1070528 RepID=A0A6C0KEA2_9ZZZZ